MKMPILKALKLAIALVPVVLTGCQSSGSKAADAGERCDRCSMRLVEHKRQSGDPKATAFDKEMKCAECNMTQTTGKKYDVGWLCICCGGTFTECSTH
jgi:hypothetical protein